MSHAARFTTGHQRRAVRRAAALLLACASVIACIQRAAAECDPQKLAPADLEADDEFAQSVSVSGQTIAIGVPLDDVAGPDSGSVRIFELQGVDWIETAMITPADGVAGDRFGTAVAISGDTLVVGAPRVADIAVGAGAVYVFERDNGAWSFVDKLLPTAVMGGDRLGLAVAIDGDTLVGGAPFHDLQGIDSGAAFVFQRNSSAWTEATMLFAPDGETDDEFGLSLAVSGDRIVVGAPLDDRNGTAAGAIHFFEHNGQQWLHEDTIRLLQGTSGHEFGRCVEIDGDVTVVGAPGDNTAGPETGAAYVYSRSGGVWSQTLKLQPGGLAANDQFGRSVSVAGDVLLVGAPGRDLDGVDAGSTDRYEYIDGAWQSQGTLTPVQLSSGDRFGWAVAMHADVAVVSAIGTTSDGAITGAAHAFNDGPACNCPADIADPAGAVDVFDLLELLSNWGAAGPGSDLAEPNDVVDVFDLLELLGAWGQC